MALYRISLKNVPETRIFGPVCTIFEDFISTYTHVLALDLGHDLHVLAPSLGDLVDVDIGP